MCFMWISEQIAIISLYSINLSVFKTKAGNVYCLVRAVSLNQTDTVSYWKGLIFWFWICQCCGVSCSSRNLHDLTSRTASNVHQNHCERLQACTYCRQNWQLCYRTELLFIGWTFGLHTADNMGLRTLNSSSLSASDFFHDYSKRNFRKNYMTTSDVSKCKLRGGVTGGLSKRARVGEGMGVANKSDWVSQSGAANTTSLYLSIYP